MDMDRIKSYIEEVLGEVINFNTNRDRHLGNLPLYITEGYRFMDTVLLGRDILIAIPKNTEELSVLQLTKHQELLKTTIGKPVVFVFDHLEAFNRKRLIEKRLNFIVPDKQLFIPELLVDLRESYLRPKSKKEKEKLIPTAQFLLLYHFMHRYNTTIQAGSLKEIAGKIGYTPMAISKAVDNLKSHDLIEVRGTKEKQIHFSMSRSELWHMVSQQNLWINPVLRRVFVDKLPSQAVLKSNVSALPEYTDMNPSRQNYYAIEKTAFYALQKTNELRNVNEYEGEYCLELWQYNPEPLIEELQNDISVVDPLSLYLSLQDNHDERIEMALDQIIEKYTW